LKPAGWEDIQRGAWANRWLGTNDEPLVYVGYVWENGDEVTYVTHDNDDFAVPEAIIRQAFDNLEAYDLELEVVEASGARLVVAAGRPFAAEWVLCEQHMLKVHELLNTDRLVVSIPRRGAMLAVAWDCPRQARATLVNLHLEGWKAADDNDAITDHLVVFDQGVKSSSLPVSPDGAVDGW
jgi:hypothetical protein